MGPPIVIPSQDDWLYFDGNNFLYQIIQTDFETLP